MDRTYVTQQKKTPVFALGLELWRDLVARHRSLQPRLQALLADLIHRERCGEVVDRSLIKGATQMLSDLGAGVYAEDFETHFLAAAADFYRGEAQEFIATSDCPGYIRKARARPRHPRPVSFAGESGAEALPSVQGRRRRRPGGWGGAVCVRSGRVVPNLPPFNLQTP